MLKNVFPSCSKVLVTALLGASFFSASTVTSVVVGAKPAVAQSKDESRVYVRKCDDDVSKPKKTSLSAFTGIASNDGSIGDWTQPGTEAYAHAKTVFDTLTQYYGTSGAFAAGVVGNLKGESNFVPDGAEVYNRRNKKQYPVSSNIPPAGKVSGVYRFGMNNPNPVNGMAGYYNIWMPHEGASNVDDKNLRQGKAPGGGGLFQETSYYRYTQSPYWGKLVPEEGWSPANQIAFIFEVHIQPRTLEPYLRHNSGKFGSFVSRTTEDLLATDDPVEASKAFQGAELRPGSYHPERNDWSLTANSLFNTENIQADPTKWNLRDASGGANEYDLAELSLAVNPSSTLDNLLDDGCNEEEIDGTGSFDNIWIDFFGSHGLNLPAGGYQGFAYDGLPEHLRPYAIDPQELGLGNGDGSVGNCVGPWKNASQGLLEQCVAFAKVMFHEIWRKDGKPGPLAYGNGGVHTANTAAAYGGTTSKIPSKGAIGSDHVSTHGHVFIVSHVFENGDILIAEQNWGHSSGRNGGVCRWSWRVLTKEYYSKRNGIMFFNPSELGYVPNAKLQANVGLGASAGELILGNANVDGASLGVQALLRAIPKENKRGYVFGATGPTYYDCSSLVQYAFREVGYSMPRTANEQYNHMRKLGRITTDWSQIKPGDLIFYKHESRAPVTHVAFYAGGNWIFHAGSSKTGIGYKALYKKGMVGIGRT